MMKPKHIYLAPLFFLFCVNPARAQQVSPADSVRIYEKLYAVSKSDKYLFKLELAKSRYYRRIYNDSSFIYAKRQLTLAKQNHNIFWEAAALSNVEFALREMGNLAEALNIQLQVLELSKQFKTGTLEGETLNSIGNTYLDMGDARTALNYYMASLAVLKKDITSHQTSGLYWALNENSNIGNAYELLNKPDSALFYELNIYHNKDFPIDLLPELMGRLGEAYVTLGKYKDALYYYRKGLADAAPAKSTIDTISINYQIAKLYDKLNVSDSGIYYARKAFLTARALSSRGNVLTSSRLLASMYSRRHKIDSAYHYQQIAIAYNDTLFGTEKFSRIQHVLSDEQQRQQKLIEEQEHLKNKYELIGGIAVFAFLLVIFLLISRNNRLQRRKNHLLGIQKTQLTEQRDQLQDTVANLHKTQTQLIQKEKMASLGELTAGIAHEIQNPLNFVNNFSEVSVELIDEMQSELKSGDKDEAIAISEDIKQNLEKIRHHGKRADFIVKGMLEHSRASTGEKQLTDLNVLCDEFMKLSYQGLRAKDKSFNAELLTHFDGQLPKANISQQDTGRVILNLFNNAFYAVNQKSKTAGPDYKPEVTVSTSAEKNNITFKVKDNGNGIPDVIKDKIMQPFFTTKPTGEGTGLGLSLSYDIVVKGHGGSIGVETKEGEFTEFSVVLPLT
jgi:two-component system NtrC family sensor kinase